MRFALGNIPLNITITTATDVNYTIESLNKTLTHLNAKDSLKFFAGQFNYAKNTLGDVTFQTDDSKIASSLRNTTSSSIAPSSFQQPDWMGVHRLQLGYCMIWVPMVAYQISEATSAALRRNAVFLYLYNISAVLTPALDFWARHRVDYGRDMSTGLSLWFLNAALVRQIGREWWILQDARDSILGNETHARIMMTNEADRYRQDEKVIPRSWFMQRGHAGEQPTNRIITKFRNSTLRQQND